MWNWNKEEEPILVEDDRDVKPLKSYVAEFLGVSFLALTIALGDGGPIGVGLTLAIMIFATAPLSGGQLNPAVTVAQCLLGNKSWKEGVFFMIAQLLGALFANFYATLMTSGDLGGPVAYTDSYQAQFCAEFIYTFALVFVVLSVTSSKNSFYGFAIGLTVAIGAWSVGDISGGCFNPAIAFGAHYSELVSTVKDFWIPEVIGGVVAAYVWRWISA